MIYLVRHGESTLNAAGIKYGLLDPPLSPRGLSQALATSRQLESVTAIWTSPLKRARDFADLLAAILDLPDPIVEHALIERPFGAAEGMTREMIASHWPNGNVPGMGTYEDVARKALDVMASIAEPTAVITHLGVIKGITGEHPNNGEVVRWRTTSC